MDIGHPKKSLVLMLTGESSKIFNVLKTSIQTGIDELFTFF